MRKVVYLSCSVLVGASIVIGYLYVSNFLGRVIIPMPVDTSRGQVISDIVLSVRGSAKIESLVNYQSGFSDESLLLGNLIEAARKNDISLVGNFIDEGSRPGEAEYTANFITAYFPYFSDASNLDVYYVLRYAGRISYILKYKEGEGDKFLILRLQRKDGKLVFFSIYGAQIYDHILGGWVGALNEDYDNYQPIDFYQFFLEYLFNRDRVSVLDKGDDDIIVFVKGWPIAYDDYSSINEDQLNPKTKAAISFIFRLKEVLKAQDLNEFKKLYSGFKPERFNSEVLGYYAEFFEKNRPVFIIDASPLYVLYVKDSSGIDAALQPIYLIDDGGMIKVTNLDAEPVVGDFFKRSAVSKYVESHFRSEVRQM